MVSSSMETTRVRPLLVVPLTRSPAITAREPAMVIFLLSRPMFLHCRLSSSPRRAPVYAATWKNANSRCCSAVTKNARSCGHSTLTLIFPGSIGAYRKDGQVRPPPAAGTMLGMEGERTELEAFYRRYIQCCNEHRFDDLGEFVDQTLR